MHRVIAIFVDGGLLAQPSCRPDILAHILAEFRAEFTLTVDFSMDKPPGAEFAHVATQT